MRLALRKFRHDDDGAALLEMTVATPFLLMLAIGAMAFGQAMLDYATVDKSMRDATRFLARLPAGAVCQAWAQDAAKNLAVYGQETAASIPAITGWSTSTITIDAPACPPPAGDFNIQVHTAFPYTNTMLAVVGLNSTFTMNVRHEQPSIGR
jgi:Flp pilus assembly protein TadG